jgi:hypothetical protein
LCTLIFSLVGTWMAITQRDLLSSIAAQTFTGWAGAEV